MGGVGRARDYHHCDVDPPGVAVREDVDGEAVVLVEPVDDVAGGPGGLTGRVDEQGVEPLVGALLYQPGEHGALLYDQDLVDAGLHELGAGYGWPDHDSVGVVGQVHAAALVSRNRVLDG